VTPLPDPWLGALLGGRYRILRALGSGGAGAVYEAEQEGLGRKVAVKLMRPELATDADLIERFRREARAAAQLGHPHIVQLFDFAEARGGEPAYLVLELVNGRSLLQVLREEAPIAPARAVALGTQILAALSAAHAAGIVHRDIKPGNVVIQDVPGVGEIAKVLDFGIARVQESEAYQRLTRTGVIIGTPRYMSPEQASALPIDGRTDLWAMGVVLYAALTGRFPFDGSPTEVVIAIMKSAVPPMNRAGVPAALEAAVRRALEKSPDARHASASAMADALRAGLASASVPQPITPMAAAATPAWTNTSASAPTPMREASPSLMQATRAALSAPTPTRAGQPTTPYPDPPVSVMSAVTPPAPALTRVPVWARWLAALVLLGGLGTVALFLAVLLAYAPRSALPELGSAPSPLGPSLGVGSTDGAPTSGTSTIFMEDALRRAAARDPSARLGMISGQHVVPSTGAVEVAPGALWSFMFIGADGQPFQVAYVTGTTTYPLVTPIEIPISPLEGEIVDSAAILATAARECPALLRHEGVAFSLVQTVGQEPTLSVAVAYGPSWMGRVLPGRVATVAMSSCD
jgi:eukaryotic-like serine/threonine-protein kinase